MFLEFSEDAGEAPLVTQSSPPVGVVGTVQSSVPDGCNGALAVVASVADPCDLPPPLHDISEMHTVRVLFVIENAYLVASDHLTEHMHTCSTDSWPYFS